MFVNIFLTWYIINANSTDSIYKPYAGIIRVQIDRYVKTYEGN